MSRYRKIEVSTYTDEKFLRLTPVLPSGQSLWIYLLTGRHTTSIPGLSSHGLASLSEQLKWPLKATREHWAEIEQLGMGRADWSAPCLWLPKAIYHNQPGNPNVVRGWKQHLAEIPACPLRDEALRSLRRFLAAIPVKETAKDSFVKAFDETFGKGFRQASLKAVG